MPYRTCNERNGKCDKGDGVKGATFNQRDYHPRVRARLWPEWVDTVTRIGPTQTPNDQSGDGPIVHHRGTVKCDGPYIVWFPISREPATDAKLDVIDCDDGSSDDPKYEGKYWKYKEANFAIPATLLSEKSNGVECQAFQLKRRTKSRRSARRQ